MWKKFKWDMFVTSFIPLWTSIVVIDIWDATALFAKNWNNTEKFLNSLLQAMGICYVQLISIIVILVLVLSSICGINAFLKSMSDDKNRPHGKIIKATKANKLSSEFLLAYILPMIAFDFGNPQKILLFLIYFGVLAFLCIRNNNIYTNILLEFKGYRIYTCDIECTVVEKHTYHDSIILSKTDLTQEEGNEIAFWDFENYIYITLDRGEK